MQYSTRFRLNPRRVLAAAGACLAVLGCGASEGDTFTTPKATQPATPAGADSRPKSIVCGDAMTEGAFEPELYMLSAMNNKLRAYPEFAAALGMDEVSDCDSARAFYEGLESYSKDHPGFDGDQPLDPTPVELPALPPDSDEESKIFNGVEPVGATNRPPVVRLDFVFSNTDPGKPPHPRAGKELHCSGTFISKNWILTAAHCVSAPAVDHCVRAGTPFVEGQCVPNWNVYGRWTLQIDLQSLPRVLTHAFVHPDWIGRQPQNNGLFRNLSEQEAMNTASHDLALLYIPDQSSLPGDVEENHAMRFWMPELDPFAPPALTFWGWGVPDRTKLLKAQATQDYILSKFPNQIAAITTAEGASFPCDGDSGGPLVRDVTIVDNKLRTRTVPAIMGVTSIGTNVCPGFSDPRPPVGLNIRWARVDNEFKFIESRMKLHMGRKFACLKIKQTTGTVAEVAECWGSPCTGVENRAAGLGCLDDEICYQPGRDFNNRCPACNNAAGCGCIIGQCLKEF